MRSAILSSALLAVAWATPLASQSTPFKDEVDHLIRAFRVNATKSGAFGDGTARQTAEVLTAMGYCHRFYTIADGPVVRPALNFLVTHRGRDGLYRDGDQDDAATTTSWVLEAMAVIAPREFARELHDGAEALARAGVENQRPFGVMLDELRTKLTGAGKPADAMKAAGAEVAESVASGPIRNAKGELEHADNVAALVRLVACQVVARGQVTTDAPTAAPAPSAPWHEVQQRGFSFLLGTLQDGVFMMPVGKDKTVGEPGLTALSLAALQTKPKAKRTAEEAKEIEAGLTWLAGQARPDGWFSDANVNYVACAAVMALSAADNPAYKPLLDKVQAKILQLQNVEPGYARSDRDYGSIGYGGDERGDLSNLQFSLQALRSTGLDPKQSDAFAKAIVFLQRCQNLKTVNDAKFEARDETSGELYRSESGDDGGAAYYPGNSPMGYIELPNGARIPRSYGSMTYALLKAYSLCGLEAGDPRVQAAVSWIAKNWTLDENPGADPQQPEATKYQGLFYYYMVAAQALETAGIEALEVGSEGPDGKAAARQIDWRADIRGKLAELQAKDGSWVNSKNGRWWEKLPVTCTCYALLALDHCR
ncbi:MAG: prenyltransferase/squalene oxidase repeat-containing protein [Planctomycetota bacterium]